MKSRKVWIWAAVSILVFCGIVAGFLLIRPQVVIPQFLVGTKKPVHVLHRYTRIIEAANVEGMTIPSPFLRETVTEFFVEGIPPELVIERLSAYTGIKEERATPQRYSFNTGSYSYLVSHSQYKGHRGSVVIEWEYETEVSMLDVYMKRLWSDWPDHKYGKVDKAPPEAGDSDKFPPLDLKRIKKARPKTEVKEK